MDFTINKHRKPLKIRETKKPDYFLIRGWKCDWSGWFPVMMPTKKNDDWEERTGDNIGYRINARLVSAPFQRGPTCGIYEIMAKKTKAKTFVVYVGSSCRSDGQSLPARINEYCAGGSHKATLINDALRKGYTLSFRYKLAATNEQAERDENQLLDKFSYAWNIITTPRKLPN